MPTRAAPEIQADLAASFRPTASFRTSGCCRVILRQVEFDSRPGPGRSTSRCLLEGNQTTSDLAYAYLECRDCMPSEVVLTVIGDDLFHLKPRISASLYVVAQIGAWRMYWIST